jgi:hypothetical protein
MNSSRSEVYSQEKKRFSTPLDTAVPAMQGNENKPSGFLQGEWIMDELLRKP